MRLGYFPGCSLHATAREYADSVTEVAGRLDVQLDEIRDWACCGATSAHATDRFLGVALPARTLALAAEQGCDRVLAPCAACFSRLATARHELRRDPALATKVREALGREPVVDVAVMNVVDMLAGELAQIAARVQRPLTGLRVACYYGCLLVRPAEIAGAGDVEAPDVMEKVVAALGATPVSWRMRLECCGGSFALSRTGSVVRLGRAVLEDAAASGADAIAVACPMCQSNLDFRQRAMERVAGRALGLPIVYLTQLAGLALGADPARLGLDRHFIPPGPALDKVRAAAAAGGEA
ncbi:MAG: CoB--CoM heterodisulfide reductase iron-sulfur subunit B family protein [Acidobacteria bacterium]|nr:CoB--CoM heterodisulfide reductase iron-sulfur subunit B family protein [Acidobacteriota bacterium]